MKKNIGIILFNIGGPENLEGVKPYLFNFFSDKFIITAPFLIRKLIAFLISRTRFKKTQKIYSLIGGKSHSKDNTLNQALKLENELNHSESSNDFDFKAYICMSYWDPMTNEVMKNVLKDHENKKFDQIIYLPLYPQFSTTTTKSSFFYWNEELEKKQFINLKNEIKHKFVCCYFDEENFIESHVEILKKKFKEAFEKFDKSDKDEGINGVRILFSAHSIPEKLTYEKNLGGFGDPYDAQVRQSVSLVMKRMSEVFGTIEFDFRICYQSKIGPVKWLSPSTEDEVLKCADEKIIPIIVPIAFVSDNSETLYELDIEYKELLESKGMKYFFRCEALNLNEKFIDSLKYMTLKALRTDAKFINANDEKSRCEKKFCSCPFNFEN
jgi:ferrochelatase